MDLKNKNHGTYLTPLYNIIQADHLYVMPKTCFLGLVGNVGISICQVVLRNRASFFKTLVSTGVLNLIIVFINIYLTSARTLRTL